MKMLQSEPTLEELDDYNGIPTSEKRFVIWGVVAVCLIVGGIYTYFRTTATVSDELIGKPYIMDTHKE
ncbi:MAG: hypothetical protein KU38_02505 [Sulfurovum sp. FS08-3]|nr:MAG: hypothetical protein KU38_02505 [Sulfurovum sp. FS08-3]